jgi:glycosyltransferase involved in cell wall biosynthesis
VESGRRRPVRYQECPLFAQRGGLMRIVHILAPAPVGGAEQVVSDLTRVLATAGAEVHLIPVLDEGTEDHPFLHGLSEDIHVHPIYLSPRAYLGERRELVRCFRAVNPQVAHTHGYRANVVGAAAARAAEIPVVSTVHGFTGSGWKIRVFQALERWSLRRADAVVAVSKPLAHQTGSMGVRPDRVHTIPNGRWPPSDILSPEHARRLLKAPPQSFHVGWIGRMSWEKAPDIMLDTIEVLRGRGAVPDLHVTLIGEGRDHGPLKARSEALGLSDRVSWPGWIPNAIRLLRGFDAVVLSSRSEGTPIVALEAMTVGVPLVATQVGGVPDLTGSEGALLVPPENPDALASAIEELRRESVATQGRVAAALARIRRDYSPERWAQAHLKVYRTVVSRR